MNKSLITIIVLAVVAVGVWALAVNNRGGDNNNTTPPPPPAAQQPQPPSPNAQVLTGEVTVNMTSSGFTPSTFTVKKGTRVNFVNQDTKARWPASAPHPTHTDYPAFDPKQAIAAGQSWTFTFDQVGAWGFHDHLFPSQFGKITVVE